MSDTFCILPWIHIYANADGSVLPCCIGDHHMHMGNVRDNTIEEILNGSKYKEMRSKMLRGERCKECSACYRNEDVGNTSFRQSMNQQFKNYISDAKKINSDGYLTDIKLRYLDVRWSNICNFKCRSCSSTYSSTWAQEDNAHGKKKPIHIFAGGDDNDKLYEQFKPYFKSIETFYFAGGEPLLTDKHYEILEYLISINRTNVDIDYNTNLSNLKYKNKSVLKLWKNFRRVGIGASLDSWGERAEYIREGTDWSVIESNIKQIKKDCHNVEMHSSSVISVFNVGTIPEFLDSLYDNNLFDKQTHRPQFYNIIHPHFYSFNVLPSDLKDKTIDKLLSNKEKYNKHVKHEIEKVISQLKNSNYNVELAKQFKDNTLYYDKIRNRNFVDTFPELKEIIL